MSEPKQTVTMPMNQVVLTPTALPPDTYIVPMRIMQPPKPEPEKSESKSLDFFPSLLAAILLLAIAWFIAGGYETISR